MTARAVALLTLVVGGGCGAPPKPPPSPNGAAMMPDSMTKAAPGAPLRDSAFGPKFAVDSTGKVVPLKKKP